MIMNKGKIQLYVSVVILAILAAVTFTLTQKKSNSSFGKELSDFAIADTASIGKVIITDQDKNRVELERKDAGYWSLNTKFRARIDAINLILATCNKIKMKNPVPENARENIIRNLAVSYHKVEYFNLDGDPLKTWYVGHAAKDQEGSYMILETPGEGKSDLPYVTYIPGFAGQLTSRFFASEKEWRFTGIFNYDPKSIASVKMVNYDAPEESFEVRADKNDIFSLIDHKGKSIPQFDTVAVRQFLVNFRKIHFETFNKGVLTAVQEDSIKKARPYYSIRVTEKSGESTDLIIFHKNVPKKDVSGADYVGDYQWDPERAFALIPSGEIVVIQFFVFDKILWPVYAFTHSTRINAQP